MGKAETLEVQRSRINDVTTSLGRGYVDYSGALQIGTKKKLNFFLWPLLLTTELCLNLLAFLSVLLQVSMGFFFSKRKAAN